jgi:nitroreductase
MDTHLAIASRRDRRRYDGRPLPPEIERRILDAGRLSGNASNKQAWRFLVVESRDVAERLAETVYVPQHVRTAAFVVAIAVPDGRIPVFDAGRAAQNMLLAAWNEGVDACPNGLADAEAAHELLGLAEGEIVAIVLTFGYPPRPVDPQSRTPEQWSAGANRRPLDEIVKRI